MKILMVTSSLDTGGAETHIFELSRALLKMGHSVSVLSGGGTLVSAFGAAGIETHILPLARKTPAAILRSLFGIRRILRHGDYDVVHAHARLPAFYLSFFRRIPLFVTTAHWVFRTDPLHRFLSRWGQKTLAVSPDIAQYLRQNYRLSKGRIHLTVNGIDTNRFYQERSSALNDPVVLNVSRLDSGRSDAAGRLIEIAERLALRYPCIRLLIVGGGSEEGMLRARADAINAQLGRTVVTLTGAVVDPLPYLRSATLFVGVSRAALEAMSCSLPVILCGDEGYRSIFTPSDAVAVDTNFCCRASSLPDNDRLFEDICTLLEDAPLRQKLGEDNRRYIHERFKAERMANDAVSVYTSLPHKKGGERILLAGFYGGGNLGDEAMLAGILQMLSDSAERVTVLSRTPRKTRRAYGIFAAGHLSFLLMLCFGKYDRLILGGGNLLQDITSRRSLFFYLLLLRIARHRGRRFTLYGGIGPLSAKGEQKAIPLLAAAERIYLRTEVDRAYLKCLLPDASSYLLPDPALLLTPPQRKGASLVLIAPKNGTEVTPTLVAFLRRLQLTPILLSMSESDVKGVRSLAKKLQIQTCCPSSVEKLQALFSSARLVVSARLHAAILALNSGTPAVLLSDNGKCDAMAELVASLSEKPPIVSAPPNRLEDVITQILSQKNTAKEVRQTLLQAIKKAQL
ncbi:MAG: glycosyltransferase [Clostridia bacterium]|nr:glycosyltransferase [Clostridia bacterium]